MKVGAIKYILQGRGIESEDGEVDQVDIFNIIIQKNLNASFT